jgi:hypothetical protein
VGAAARVGVSAAAWVGVGTSQFCARESECGELKRQGIAHDRFAHRGRGGRCVPRSHLLFQLARAKREISNVVGAFEPTEAFDG